MPSILPWSRPCSILKALASGIPCRSDDIGPVDHRGEILFSAGLDGHVDVGQANVGGLPGLAEPGDSVQKVLVGTGINVDT